MKKIYKQFSKWEISTPFYSFARSVVILYSRLFCKVIVKGGENIPPDGSLIIAANHVSYFDPPLVAAVWPRQVFFIAKSTLFTGILGIILRGIKAFPVHQGSADLSALRTSLEYLGKEKVIGIFPQGKRVPQMCFEEGGMGLSLLAARSKSNVIPVGIYYEKLGDAVPGIFSKVGVNIGKPEVFEYKGENTKEEFESYVNRIMEKIGVLTDEIRREILK